MVKLITRIIVVALLLACAANKQASDKGRRTTMEDYEGNLNTELGLTSKKKKIDALKDELDNINTQIEERQRLLEELNNIKKVIDTDTLVEEGAAY
jgi:uncharacterized membrane protein